MKQSLTAVFLASLFALPALSGAAPESAKKPAAHATSTAKNAKANAKVTAKTKKPKSAPADEYFGRQKYSILGIRNALHDLNIRYDGTPGRVAFLYHDATNIEDAMHDWDKKYHGDLWLAHYMFQLDQIYMRVPPDQGRAKVDGMSKWIIAVYPKTYFGKYLVNIRKQRDKKEKEQAIAAKAAAQAAATPAATPGSNGSLSSDLAASPAPASSPVATPQPVATPVTPTISSPTNAPAMMPATPAATATP